ncbi:hypothetical protein [Legionella clemsonensis]|uniref:Uncharacterized protein n=1 Tax=Legionella clemsonensis TaxID=1867846 RepID=A0A222P4P4_9GAMM|nr:hypothetical protein [Legionella clemsonensis]ASQ46797.1 hypothetical protein clem_11270 [Legionella clemsonensis]
MNKTVNTAFFSRNMSLQMYSFSMRRTICRQHACGLSLRFWEMLKQSIFCSVKKRLLAKVICWFLGKRRTQI